MHDSPLYARFISQTEQRRKYYVSNYNTLPQTLTLADLTDEERLLIINLRKNPDPCHGLKTLMYIQLCTRFGLEVSVSGFQWFNGSINAELADLIDNANNVRYSTNREFLSTLYALVDAYEDTIELDDLTRLGDDPTQTDQTKDRD